MEKVQLIAPAEDEQERKEQLEAKGLDGDVKDKLVNYKDEALKTFLQL